MNNKTRKSIKTKYLSLAIVFLLLIAVSSCKKESINATNDDGLQTSLKSASSKMLKFSSYDEFNNEFKLVCSYTFEQKRLWEESKDFVSLGRASDEFYLSLDQETLNIEAVKELERLNSDYLQFINNEDGEYTLESAFWDNPLRRFINIDKMYQIGEIVFKLFDFGTISTHVSHIQKLKEITENNYLNFKNDADLTIIKMKSDGNILKDGQYDCGKDTENRVTNGNNRIYIHINNYNWNFKDGNFPAENGTMNSSRYNVRAYKRTLGIWYWCIRNITCSIKIATDRYIYRNNIVTTEGYYRRQEKYPLTGTSITKYTDNISGTFDERISYVLNSPDNSHFGGYNCWGSQPSAGPVTIQCNTSIVN